MFYTSYMDYRVWMSHALPAGPHLSYTVIYANILLVNSVFF